MKITVDLDDFWQDDDTVANHIRYHIKEEIRLYVKREIKAALKEHQGKIQRAAKKAINRDWRKVADLLEKIDSE